MSRLRKRSEAEKPEVRLKQFFERNGYVRIYNASRRKQLGCRHYKKGYEVRLVVSTPGELAQLRHLLKQVGFKAGKPFQKHNRLVQPVYGKAAVEWFLPQKVR